MCLPILCLFTVVRHVGIRDSRCVLSVRACCACVHVSMAVAICTQTKGLRWEGYLLPLLYLVCVLHQPLHQPLHCILHCLHSLVESAACITVTEHGRQRLRQKGTSCALLFNSRPDFVFLVVAHILNHNSGGCSGNFGFLQLALGFEGSP